MVLRSSTFARSTFDGTLIVDMHKETLLPENFRWQLNLQQKVPANERFSKCRSIAI